MNQIYKITGTVVLVDEKNLHLNLHDNSYILNGIKDDNIEKIKKLDERMLKKITKIKVANNIETINIFKPIYYKNFNYNGKEVKNLHAKLTISKIKNKGRIIKNNKEWLGFIIQAYVKPSIYNFTDPKNNEKKIRGWKLNLISIQKLN